MDLREENIDVKSELSQSTCQISHLALDIGGSLIKLVYFSSDGKSGHQEGEICPDRNESIGFLSDGRKGPILKGRLHFAKFETSKLDVCLEFINSSKLHLGDSCFRLIAIHVKATGGGAYKYADLFKERLGISLDKEDEMDCLVAGANFLLKAVHHEAFIYTDGRKEFLQIDHNDLFPYLLVNIGSGVSMIKVDRDGKFERVLAWQQAAARIGTKRSAASFQWLSERISLARYAHFTTSCSYVFFSRALRDQQQVLWISDDGVPDLGGINEESTCFADEVHQPLKIHHLAVNALLKSNQVNDMEGGSLLGFEDIGSGSNVIDEQYGFDEATSSAPALRVLKQLIQWCLSDAVTSGNAYADAILQHQYRWLCSPQSKLHDSALHRALHKVMQKVFALLLAEFRKLGATIIFPNFSKVIKDTENLVCQPPNFFVIACSRLCKTGTSSHHIDKNIQLLLIF
ncbi:hypothetical protein K2173_001313 [Erythroxylum novogranatense]|uniref:DNA polymerase epsilon catalytic subunit n=1 Tax=Erythroxylum novogranatense TaxID=1862640 RepID=A0AAV8T3D8_9ROSI|nr:hypothetical protein K2173_001313 [Erythroxylum novogranatense]